MGLLAANMLTEARRENPSIIPFVEIAWPGGTKRYAQVTLGSESLGMIRGKIPEGGWGDLAYAVPDAGGLSPMTTEFHVDDTDGTIRAELEAATGHQVRRCAATIKATSLRAGFSAADNTTLAALQVAGWGGRTRKTIFLGPPDLNLSSVTPDVMLTPADWPNAAPDAYNQHAPLLYGSHDAQSSAQKGMVPLILVDSTTDRWLICLGKIKTLGQVYINGTLVSPSSNYALSYYDRNGATYSTVLWNTSPPADDDVVTVDCDGYEATGDGSGALITNPVEQIKHFLINFVFNKWRTGNWSTLTTEPIDSTTFTTAIAFMTALGAQGSKRLAGAQRKGGDILNEWAESSDARLWWTNLGKIGVGFENHGDTTVYPTTAVINLVRDAIGEIDGPHDDLSSFLTRVACQFVYGEADQQYLRNMAFWNPRFTEVVEESFSQAWSYSGVSFSIEAAREVASRMLLARQNARELLGVTLPFWAFDFDLLTRIPYHDQLQTQKYWGLKKWQRRLHAVYQKTLSLNSMTVRLGSQGLRLRVVTLSDTGLAKRTASITASFGETLCRLHVGQRTYTRTGSAWIADAGDGRVLEVGANASLYDISGTLLERASLNYMKQSSFANWDSATVPTGWTVANVSQDANDRLFDTTVSAYSMDMQATAGSAATATRPVAALPNRYIALSVDYKCHSGDALIWYVKATSGANSGKFFRASDSTWVVGDPGNAFASSLTKTRGVRHSIDMGATGITAEVQVRTAVASQRIHVYHVQVDTGSGTGAWATSRIVTGVGEVTRSAGVLTYTNNSTARMWDASHATSFMRFVPQWNSADDTAHHTLWFVTHDADDYEWIYYDGVNKRFVFERSRGGVITRAVLAMSVTRDTVYDVATVHTGVEGELDLTSYTQRIYVRIGSGSFTQGTDAVAAGTVNENSTSSVHVGHKSGGEQLDAAVREHHLLPVSYELEEIARLPL